MILEHFEIESPLGADRLEELTRLFGQYRAFYGVRGSRPNEATTAERAFLQERIIKGDSVIALAISSLTGQAAGFAQCYPLFTSLRMAPFWLLNDLFIDERARGQGVGRMLIRYLQERCRQEGVAGMMLDTALTNGPARALYKGTGWQANDKSAYYYWYVEGGYVG